MSGAASSAGASTSSLPLKPSYNLFRGRKKSGKQSLDIPEATEEEPTATLTAEEVQQKQRNHMLQAVDKLKRLAGINKDKKAATSDVPVAVDEDAADAATPATGDKPADDTSETAVAKRIAGILSSVPPFYTGATPTSVADGTQPKPAEGITDTKLLNLLSTSSVMNGTRTKGRRSVWSLLDRITVQMLPTAPEGSPGATVLAYTGVSTGLVDSSIMLVIPLQFDADTKVELAQSEVRRVQMDAFDLEMEAAIAGSIKVAGWWPWSGKNPAKPPPKTKEVRVWIPSATHISFQAAWWGYRLYLPTPVLKILNDKELAAAQRAAMIMAALQWLISNAPMSSLPPQLVAILGIVKAVLPIVGYIGGFIAWSWTQIKSYDKGQGVVLSATWLLPIALIPGTWDYVPAPPPPPPPPAPAPDAPTTPAPAPSPPADPKPSAPNPAPSPQPPIHDSPITLTPPPAFPTPGHDSQSPVIIVPNPTGDPSSPTTVQ